MRDLHIQKRNLFFLFFFLVCSPVFAYDFTYNPFTGVSDYVGNQASGDIQIVGSSGDVMRVSDSNNHWAASKDSVLIKEVDGSPSYYPSFIQVSSDTLTPLAGNGVFYQPGGVGGGAEINNLETLITGIADDEIPVGSAANDSVYTAVGDCDDAGGNHLNYDTATNAFSCGTSVEATLADIADGTIAEDLVNTANPWADNEVADNITAGTAGALAADPANCAGGGLAGGVTAAGVAEACITPSAGTDITADLEEEAHASEHAVGAADTTFPADPNADKYLMWDDDPGALVWSNPGGTGDVVGPAANNDHYIPKWDGANSKTLENGFDTDGSGECAANTVCLGGHTHSGGGATDFNLPIYSAKLTGAYVVFTPPTADACTQGAQIDAGDGNWRLLFDATTDECATWQFVIPSNYASTPTLVVQYSMTSGNANEVEFEGAIMCVTPGDAADIGTASFANAAVASDTVPGTAGFPDTATISLTDDSCAAGDIAFVVLSKDADDATNDDATGDTEVIGVDFDYA